MRDLHRLLPVILVAGFLTGPGGCESSPKSDGGSPGAADDAAPEFGGPGDTRKALQLWSDMDGYTAWSPYPGMAGWQAGERPHGTALKYYVNPIVAGDPENPGNGSIIVVENYGTEGGPLMTVSVMKKVRGYDPDSADWFWVKYGPDGTVMRNLEGITLAGRVGVGMSDGCITCHRQAGGGDYLFSND